MTANLYAACKAGNELIAKKINIDATIQHSVASIFLEQEISFKQDIDEELDFNMQANYKLENNELFTINIPEEAQIFEDAVCANLNSIPELNINNFAAEDIKALFMGFYSKEKIKILVQKFNAAQILNKSNGFTFLQDKNMFRKLTEQAFSINSYLVCIIENNKIKFTSERNAHDQPRCLNIHRNCPRAETALSTLSRAVNADRSLENY